MQGILSRVGPSTMHGSSYIDNPARYWHPYRTLSQKAEAAHAELERIRPAFEKGADPAYAPLGLWALSRDEAYALAEAIADALPELDRLAADDEALDTDDVDAAACDAIDTFGDLEG